MSLKKVIYKIIENYLFEQNNFSVGQKIQYQGRYMTIKQILPTLPSNFETVNSLSPIKLPTDKSKYPIVVLQNDNNPTDITYVSRLGQNNLTPIGNNQTPQTTSASAGTTI